MHNCRKQLNRFRNIVLWQTIGLQARSIALCCRLHKFKYDLPELLIEPTVYFKHIRTHTKILQQFQPNILERIYEHLYKESIEWKNIPKKQWIRKLWQLQDGEKQDEFYCCRTQINLKKEKQKKEHESEQNQLTLELYLRINDFPQEPLYTVIYDDIQLLHVNDFPSLWKISS